MNRIYVQWYPCAPYDYNCHDFVGGEYESPEDAVSYVKWGFGLCSNGLVEFIVHEAAKNGADISVYEGCPEDGEPDYFVTLELGNVKHYITVKSHARNANEK